MFPVYCGKCLLLKAVQPWWQIFRLWRRGWNGGVEVAETTGKRLLCCGFRRSGKTMGHVSMFMEDMSRNKCFSRFEYHMFYILYSFMTHLLTLRRIDVHGVTPQKTVIITVNTMRTSIPTWKGINIFCAGIWYRRREMQPICGGKWVLHSTHLSQALHSKLWICWRSVTPL
jgi:hypothetical protein